MTAAGRFRCCQCCRDGEDPDYHTEHGADSHEIPCPTCDASPRLSAKVDDLRAERDALAARLAAVEAALAMSDHEPTNRVWHEQMQRIRAALATDTTKETDR